jgi:hypothetical protein
VLSYPQALPPLQDSNPLPPEDIKYSRFYSCIKFFQLQHLIQYVMSYLFAHAWKEPVACTYRSTFADNRAATVTDTCFILSSLPLHRVSCVTIFSFLLFKKSYYVLFVFDETGEFFGASQRPRFPQLAVSCWFFMLKTVLLIAVLIFQIRNLYDWQVITVLYAAAAYVLCLSFNIIQHSTTANKTSSMRTEYSYETLDEYYQLKKLKLNSVAFVRKRIIPTKRQPLVGEVSANLCGCCVVSTTNSYGR